MRRTLLVLALPTVADVVVATGMELAGAQSRSACGAAPAGAFAADDTHSLELTAHGFMVDRFVDAKGHSLRLLGNGMYEAPFPGWNENSVVNQGAFGTDIIFDSGHPNAYAAAGHVDPTVSDEISVRRYTADVQLDGSASWYLPTTPPAGLSFSLAYANGQALGKLRLCVAGRGGASARTLLAPDGLVEGSAAADRRPPEIRGRLVRTTSRDAIVAIVATDPGGRAASGVAVVWWGPVGHYSGRYLRPVRTSRDAKLLVVAMDRAGNIASSILDVATLPRPTTP